MYKLSYILFILLSINYTAFGQAAIKQQKKVIVKTDQMNTEKISNPIVKNAIDALQKGNKSAWYAHFTTDVIFTDDGKTLDFKSFFDHAFDKKEKFLTIDRIENEGKNIYGNFFAGQWGTFRVFFKFALNAEGKITKLDIGQGN